MNKTLKSWLKRSSAIALLFAVGVAPACGAPSAQAPAASIAPIAPVTLATVATPTALTGDAAPPVASAAPAPPEDDLPVPILSTDPTWGRREAYVTIVEFAELQCPFCARVSKTLGALEAKYGPDTLRVVWKHEPLPFHKRAQASAEAGQGVFALGGSDAFWSFADAAFSNQADLSDDALARFATDVGVDGARIRFGLNAHEWAQYVEADHALAKRIGVSGTPMFFINGVSLSGAQPESRFVEMIDDQLAKAKAHEAAGTPRDRLYAALSKEAVAAHPLQPRTDASKEDLKTVFNVPLGKAVVRGNASAPVTIVEFGDFQCPFTKRAFETLAKVRATYGDKVRFAWLDEPLPFHVRALPAAKLAREARAQKGDAAYWAVHDALFASQPALEDDDLARIASGAGLDVKKAMAAVHDHRYEAAIRADADRADDLQASGTPHFFINGRRLVGAQPFEKFQMIIDEEIAHAAAVIAQGTKPEALYDALIRYGKSGIEEERKTIAIPAGAPSKGSANAPVVIQELADFECPFCARVETTLDDVARAYPGKVRLVWRDLPLAIHPNAALAAEAAREAKEQRGNDGFWAMHDRLLSGENRLSRAALDGYARAMGLDMAKWGAALDARAHAAIIEKDARAAGEAGITGTPAFLIGDYFVSGAQPFSKFRKVIERVLRERKAGPPVSGVVSARWNPSAASASAATGSPATRSANEARAGSTLTVHYVGRLTDGRELDSSRKRGTPFVFVLGKGQVIKGWEQGLVGMKVGEKRVLTLPPDLAYGERGVPPTIPPSSTLIFDIELLDVQQP